jgi:hypothetical protein
MIPLRQEIQANIIRAVAEREQYHEYQLPPIDREFLVETMTSLVFESIDKFVFGSKEHNGEHDGSFIHDCNHLMELDKEIIDFIMYSRAIRFRKLKH